MLSERATQAYHGEICYNPPAFRRTELLPIVAKGAIEERFHASNTFNLNENELYEIKSDSCCNAMQSSMKVRILLRTFGFFSETLLEFDGDFVPFRVIKQM